MPAGQLVKKLCEAGDIGEAQFYKNVKALADALGYDFKYTLKPKRHGFDERSSSKK